jgi:hypothetical protein
MKKYESYVLLLLIIYVYFMFIYWKRYLDKKIILQAQYDSEDLEIKRQYYGESLIRITSKEPKRSHKKSSSKKK